MCASRELVKVTVAQNRKTNRHLILIFNNSILFVYDKQNNLYAHKNGFSLSLIF